MKEFTVGKNDAGQRLDRFVSKTVPLLPASLLQKYIRLKRIKVNGKGSLRDARLNEGDVLQMYINDEFFDTPKAENAYLTVSAPKIHIVYEDENILLADKKPGQAVHPHDGAEYGKTLIDHIQAYLYAKGEWKPRQEHSFAPSTGTPAASSLPQKTQKPCEFSIKKSRTGNWTNGIFASSTARPSPEKVL